MAYNFPSSPTPGQLYPTIPNNQTQYKWDAAEQIWKAVSGSALLNNYQALNTYSWPTTLGGGGTLVSNSAGELMWSQGSFSLVSLLEDIDGVLNTFTLVKAGTTDPYSPQSLSNLIVFLGGVVQIPGDSYSLSGNTITFTETPAEGSTFCGFSNFPPTLTPVD